MREARSLAGLLIDGSLQAPGDKPWLLDWFQFMRRLEARNPQFPRFGCALHPEDEPVRIGQTPALSFAASEITDMRLDQQGHLRIEQAGFGLFGPNGALPLHITEYVRERLAYDDDRALSAFADIFHHRVALMFYRAWASAQPANSLDRPEDDKFADYVGAIIGYRGNAYRGRDAVADHAKRYFSGHLVRQTRNPEGLKAILEEDFNCPFRIQEWVPQWLRLSKSEQTCLGDESASAQLGVGAVCGAMVLDRQYRFRLHAGPLDLEKYRGFLPGAGANKTLRDWVRNYLGYEFRWDVQLVLRRNQAPPLRLGGDTQLGWTTWLGKVDPARDLADLILEGEREFS